VADNLTTSYADCHEIWQPHPPGNLRASPGLYRDSFNFTFINEDQLRNLGRYFEEIKYKYF